MVIDAKSLRLARGARHQRRADMTRRRRGLPFHYDRRARQHDAAAKWLAANDPGKDIRAELERLEREDREREERRRSDPPTPKR
jgi:hypothetical protein